MLIFVCTFLQLLEDTLQPENNIWLSEFLKIRISRRAYINF